MNETLEKGVQGERKEYGELTQQQIEAMSTDELLLAYKQTGREALKWPLVLRYVGLIKSIALQISGVYSSFAQVEDIINEGVIALVGAVDKFDPSRGIKFETYVAKRIRGMIIDLARRQDWLPRSVRKRSREIDQAVNVLYSSLGRFPTDKEVAQKLGVSTAQYQENLMNTALSNVMSLEALFESREQGNAGSSFADDGPEFQPEQRLMDAEFRKMLTEGIQSLRQNEQLVLSLYYEKELNMREIAQVLGVSEPRISQIHSKSIQKLRIYLEKYIKSGA